MSKKTTILAILLLVSLIINIVFITQYPFKSNIELISNIHNINSGDTLNEFTNKYDIKLIDSANTIKLGENYVSDIFFALSEEKKNYEPIMIVGDALKDSLLPYELTGQIDTIPVKNWIGTWRDIPIKKGTRDYAILVFLPDEKGNYEQKYIILSKYIVE